MANTQSTLPEGTDSIVSDAVMDDAPGGNDFAGVGSSDAGPGSGGEPGSAAKAKLGDAAAKVGDATSGLRAQAADKAREYALQGKDRAVDALENVIRMIDDTASTIDDKVGAQYGDYARRASDYVVGFADTLRDKDVDELFDDARQIVRQSPAIAIGAAATLGFVIARLIKAGIPPETTADGSGPAETASGSATGTQDRPTPSTATTVPAADTF